MTNLAGIAPIEQTKALTHIMASTHSSELQMHIFPHSLNELNFTSMTSQAIQLDVQGKISDRFAPSWLYSFSMPWCPFGMTKEEWYCSFIPFEDAWREPRPCRVQPRANSGVKETCELHSSIRLMP